MWGRGLSPPVGFTRMTVDEFLSKVKPLFPSIKRHFDSALLVLTEGKKVKSKFDGYTLEGCHYLLLIFEHHSAGDETCEEHWNIQSTSARNPDIPNLVHSKTAVSTSMFKKVLHCFNAVKFHYLIYHLNEMASLSVSYCVCVCVRPPILG